MPNFAAEVKKQTDKILRQQKIGPDAGVTITGGSGGGIVVNPSGDLARHKTSGDHDGRYYTEAEIDGKLNFLTLTDTPAAYTAQGGKIVAVKADVSGIEFVAAPAAENGIPVGGTENQLAAKNSALDYDVKWMDAPAAANGLPAGGVIGHFLKKKSATDFDSEWVTPALERWRVPNGTVSAYDDEFEDGSLDGGWTQLAKAGYANTYYEVSGLKGLSAVIKGGSGTALSGLIKSFADLTPPFYIETAVQVFASGANYPSVGLIFADGNTYGAGNQAYGAYLLSTNYSSSIQKWTSFTTRASAAEVALPMSGVLGAVIYLRLEYVSANTFRLWHSIDGVVWFSISGSQSYTMTPTHFGVFACAYTLSSDFSVVWKYFRVRSGTPANG